MTLVTAAVTRYMHMHGQLLQRLRGIRQDSGVCLHYFLEIAASGKIVVFVCITSLRLQK